MCTKINVMSFLRIIKYKSPIYITTKEKLNTKWSNKFCFSKSLLYCFAVCRQTLNHEKGVKLWYRTTRKTVNGFRKLAKIFLLLLQLAAGSVPQARSLVGGDSSHSLFSIWITWVIYWRTRVWWMQRSLSMQWLMHFNSWIWIVFSLGEIL